MGYESVSSETARSCCNRFKEATQVLTRQPCAVSGRAKIGMTLMPIEVNAECIQILQPDSSFISSVDQSELSYNDMLCTTDLSVLNGVLLYRPGIQLKPQAQVMACSVSESCYSSLMKGKMPKFALANHCYRGSLPEQFHDLTMAEEIICARSHVCVRITRIYDYGAQGQRRYHGNTYCHPANPLSTLKVLPLMQADISNYLHVLYIGNRAPVKKDLPFMLKVRKQKVLSFLLWLKSNNKLYQNIDICQDTLNDYPEDGIPSLLFENVQYERRDNVAQMFDNETAGFDDHPAILSESNASAAYMEHVGCIDPNGSARRKVFTVVRLASASWQCQLGIRLFTRWACRC